MLDIPENIKRLFKDDFVKKDIRIHFPDGERQDIVTKDIYGTGTSFCFTESVCSQNNLKFGLAEASMLEFDTVDVENIKGCRIEASYEVTDPDSGALASVPLGIFTVNSCQKQNDMRRRKVVAYSGAKLEVSPLTMAKLSIPSLNAHSYRLDIEELMGQGERNRDRYADKTEEEFTLSIYGKDYEDMTIEPASYVDQDGSICSVFCDIEYKYITKRMYPQETHLYPDPSAWYDIRSEINNAGLSASWDSVLKDIRAMTDRLKIIAEDQDKSRREGLNRFLQACDIYAGNYAVRLDVRQTYNKKKLTTSKYVAVQMDQADGGIRKSRYPLDNILDIVNKRAGEVDGNTVTIGDVGDATMTFICPMSISMRITKQPEEGPLEEVFSKSATSGRKDILIRYGSILKRHTFQHELPEIGGTVIEPPELPYLEFVREQRADGYYYCTDPEKNLRKAADSAAEIQARFLHTDRYGILKFVKISDYFGLYPEETLYPADDLYPAGTQDTMTTACCKNLWYDDYEVQPYGAVRVNYKNRSGNDEVLSYRFNRKNRNVYHFKDNYIFKTRPGGWDPADIRDLLDTYFIPAVDGIRYIPYEAEITGLPYMEAGDVVTILTRTGGIEAFVFRRTLKGINCLTDSLEARGDEVNEADEDDSATTVTLE